MFECCRARLMWLSVLVWKGLLPVWMNEWKIRQYTQMMSSGLFGLNCKLLKQWLNASLSEWVYLHVGLEPLQEGEGVWDHAFACYQRQTGMAYYFVPVLGMLILKTCDMQRQLCLPWMMLLQLVDPLMMCLHLWYGPSFCFLLACYLFISLFF